MSVNYVLAAMLISAILVNVIRYIQYRRERARLIFENFERLQRELEEGFRNALIIVTAERHDGIIFFYDAETSKYLCRGRTKAELEAAVQDLFPGKMFVVDSACDPEIIAELEL